MTSNTLTQRKKTQIAESAVTTSNNSLEANDDLKEQFELDNEPSYSLMEEIFLLGLKDVVGHTSFWNDCISAGLRGCILIELGFRNRIKLDQIGNRRRALKTRKVILKKNVPTGNILLDQTIKHLKETEPPESVQNWIDYLTGDSWNLFKMKYHIGNVRERLAKNLVEKGVLTTTKQNYFFFDMTTHPLVDKTIKEKLVKRVHESLLNKWVNDPKLMDVRTLALLLMAHASDVLENVLDDLNDDEYELATSRMSKLTKLDFEQQLTQVDSYDVMWAVFSAYFK